jgi:hypothetical protein
MNKGTILRLSFLLPFTLIFALHGCGGDSSDNSNEKPDNTNNTDNSAGINISSKIWMTSNCIQDDAGVYFKSLYEFTADGTILQGFQDFQDTSCTTPKDETVLPYNQLTTYTDGGSTTLQDGTNGNLITIAFSDILTVDGFYTITSQNTLCFTSNFSINTGDFRNIPGPAEPVDYNNCLTVYNATNNQSPNPNPNPSPSPQNSELVGMWWLNTLCYISDTGGTHTVILKFTEDNKLLYANLPYTSNDCSGNPGTSSTFMEFESPITYSDLGETTLSNGTLGHNLRFSGGSYSEDGYYTFNTEHSLCLSYNLGFNDDINTTDIDYENCLPKLNSDN